MNRSLFSRLYFGAGVIKMCFPGYLFTHVVNLISQAEVARVCMSLSASVFDHIQRLLVSFLIDIHQNKISPKTGEPQRH